MLFIHRTIHPAEIYPVKIIKKFRIKTEYLFFSLRAPNWSTPERCQTEQKQLSTISYLSKIKHPISQSLSFRISPKCQINCFEHFPLNLNRSSCSPKTASKFSSLENGRASRPPYIRWQADSEYHQLNLGKIKIQLPNVILRCGATSVNPFGHSPFTKARNITYISMYIKILGRRLFKLWWTFVFDGGLVINYFILLHPTCQCGYSIS